MKTRVSALLGRVDGKDSQKTGAQRLHAQRNDTGRDVLPVAEPAL